MTVHLSHNPARNLRIDRHVQCGQRYVRLSLRMNSHKPVLQLFDVLSEDTLLFSHLLVPVVKLFHALCIATTEGTQTLKTWMSNFMSVDFSLKNMVFILTYSFYLSAPVLSPATL